MAELYRGKIVGSQGFEKLVAIKKILPHLAKQDEFIKAFIDEARLAAHLQHPNIVQIYDFGEMEDSYFISMEYLSGVTLKGVLAKAAAAGKPLKLPLSLFYILPLVCEGLSYAHNLRDLAGTPLNLIHRDIGPQNIFITFDGEVKLIDFGIAKASSHDATTYVGSLKGKLAYMSPEQASGQEIDSRSDLFSVGILLYELATGHRLYSGETQQILAKAAKGEFQPAEKVKQGLPPNLYRIISKALAIDPERRYQSAAALRRDLDRCADELAVRLSSRHLAKYMRELFQAESSQEDLARRQVVPRAGGASGPRVDITLPGGTGDATVFASPARRRKVASPSSPYWRPLLLFILALVMAGAVWWLDIPATRQARQSLSQLQWPQDLLMAGYDSLVESTASVEEKIQSRIDQLSGARKDLPPIIAVNRRVEALDYLRRLLKDNDVKGLADKKLFNEQVSYLIIEYPEEARQRLLALAQQYPEQAVIYYQLGRLHWSLEEIAEARANYSRAMELDPSMDRAINNLALLHASSGEVDRALALFQQVADMRPAYLDEVLFNMALLHRHKGESGISQELLQQAVARNPENEQAVKLLAKIRDNR